MLTMVNLYTVSNETKHLEYTGSLEYLFLEWRDHGGTKEQTGYTEKEFYQALAEDGRIYFGGGSAPLFAIETIEEGI